MGRGGAAGRGGGVSGKRAEAGGGGGGSEGRGGMGAWRASVLMHPPFPRARAASWRAAVLVAPPGSEASSPGTHTRTDEVPSRLNSTAATGASFRRTCASLYGLNPGGREPGRRPRGIYPERPPTLR
ncbi:hypothetical protein ACE1SV_49630 [Streptomyces sennicomposti]